MDFRDFTDKIGTYICTDCSTKFTFEWTHSNTDVFPSLVCPQCGRPDYVIALELTLYNKEVK